MAVIISAGIGAGSARAQSKQVAKQNRKQREFNEYQRTTAFQVARQDMEAAKINPYFVYGGAGGQAQAHSPSLTQLDESQSYGDNFATAINSINSSRRAGDERNVLKTNARKMSAEGGLLREKQVTEKQTRNTARAMEGKLQAETKNINIDRARLEAEAAGAGTAKQIEQSPAGKALRWIDRIGNAVNPFSRLKIKGRR